MKENVGMIDRMIRFILAIIFIILGFMHSAWWFIPAAVALLTGLLGWCGLYAVCGCNTCSVKSVKTVKSSKPARKAARKRKR